MAFHGLANRLRALDPWIRKPRRYGRLQRITHKRGGRLFRITLAEVVDRLATGDELRLALIDGNSGVGRELFEQRIEPRHADT